MGVPKKNRLFYSYAPGESFLIESGETKKINCGKKQPKDKIVALSSVFKPSDLILNKLKEFNVNLIVKMASSYKFCVIATGEYDIYAASERANEWDYACRTCYCTKCWSNCLKPLMKNLFYMEKKIIETLVCLLKRK